MTWEQKLEAIQALCGWNGGVAMRKPGDWYVTGSMSVSDGKFATGKYGNGRTPEEAVENHWEIYTNLKPNEHIVLGFGESAKRVRWNGYMWQDVSELVA